jgi:putative spermidine/putrescine transport system ATP-binding protein
VDHHLSGVVRPVQPGKSAIELRQITKRYGKDSVVDRVSTHIAPGEFFSLLGPSGSGKTTTLMMIAGFADVDEGQILVDGVDIADRAPQHRGFGMVFQNYAIFPHLNVFDNVAFPLRARQLPKEEVRQRVAQALELVRLERFADRFSRQLSGGQQQRVAIARAIVFHPSVVLMDEPLGALDKNLRYQMQVEIKEIQQRLGMTVVYVTHDQEEAMNMSDRIAIMNSGRIEQVRRPEEIYDSPASNFIARFLGEANLIEGVVQDVGDGFAVLRTAAGLALRARVVEPLQPAAQANLFVRPERVTLAPADTPAATDPSRNAATGRLVQTSFLGNILRHAVEIEAGIRVTVDVQNASRGLARRTGENVLLTWAAADSVILQR